MDCPRHGPKVDGLATGVNDGDLSFLPTHTRPMGGGDAVRGSGSSAVGFTRVVAQQRP